MKESRISLEQLRIASPCPASWDKMKGDDRVRFCEHCQLHVYNLSELPRDEAEKFIGQREGRTCVLLFRRQDGTVLTRDCPVGIRTLRDRLIRSVAALVGLLLALTTGTLLASRTGPRTGGVSREWPIFARWIQPEPPFYPLLGDVCLPPPQQQPAAPANYPEGTGP